MTQIIARSSLLPQYLQNYSLAYMNKSYVADMVAPAIDVPSPVAKIWKWAKGTTFRDEAKLRAPGAGLAPMKLAGAGVSIATQQYDATVEITQEDIQNAGLTVGQPPTDNLKMDAMSIAVDKMLLKVERATSAVVLGTTWADGSANGQDAQGLWGIAGSTNTLFADIQTGKDKIRTTSGQIANKLLVDYKTWIMMRDADAVRDVVKYTSGEKVVTRSALAAMLDLDEIIVGSAVYSSAEETQAEDDFTSANVWDGVNSKGFGFLYYVPPRPGLKTPSALYRPRIKVLDSGLYRATYEHVRSENHAWAYQAMEDFQVLATGTDLGYLWKDTNAD